MCAHPHVHVQDWGSMEKTPARSYYEFPAAGCDKGYVCQNNSLGNLLAGLEGRVFNIVTKTGVLAPPPKPKRGEFGTLMRPAFSALQGQVRRIPSLSVREFVMQAPSHKRKVYERAAELFMRIGVRPMDWKVKTFVKFEKLLKKPGKVRVPRVIQPRSPVYSLALGRFTRPIEHQLYGWLNSIWGGVTVMKGLTPEQVGAEVYGKWSSFPNPVAVGLDASRFDQHVSRDALRWEHAVYLMCNDSPDFEFLLSKQLKNQGVAYSEGKKLTYETDGCRMSGDMNTGMGNCLLMCSMMYSYCKRHGLRPGVDVHLLNNGDDCVLILDQKNFGKLKNIGPWFLRLGFTMEEELPVTVLEEIEFCQSQPVCVDGQWLMVRSLKALSKDSLCLLEEGQLGAWLGAVGRAGLALTGGVPIYQSVYSSYMRSGFEEKGVTRNRLLADSGFMRAAVGMRRRVGVISDETRVSFWRAFGVTPCHQIAIEEYYESLAGRCSFKPSGLWDAPASIVLPGGNL
nr:MAG: RNA-dependent RNA polymerase [Chemarfal virus 66]